MDKDRAIQILEDWISERTQDDLGEHRDMRLPIIDKMIYHETDFEHWTFKGLIKIAYDLEDKKSES